MPSVAIEVVGEKSMQENSSNIPHSNLPLVSIAMCTYNGERYLEEQLSSLIEQDYPNLEIIICDDKSTDNTINILGTFEKKYDYVQVVYNEVNLGFMKNFEKALLACKGDYIALCDQDDVFLPHKISTFMEHIGDFDLIYSQVKLVDAHLRPFEGRRFPDYNLLEGRCHMSLLFANCITGHASMIRRRLLKKALPIPNSVKFHDHWLGVVAGANGGVKLHNEVLSLYRDHDNNDVLNRKTKRKKEPGLIKRKNLRINKLREEHSYLRYFTAQVLLLDSLSACERSILQNFYLLLGEKKTLLNNTKYRKFLLNHQKLLLALWENPKLTALKYSRGVLNSLF